MCVDCRLEGLPFDCQPHEPSWTFAAKISKLFRHAVSARKRKICPIGVDAASQLTNADRSKSVLFGIVKPASVLAQRSAKVAANR
jgi:hypothetical protein